MSNGNDINPKIGLEYSEFKKGITDLNRNIRLIESEFRAATAGMDDWRDSSEGLEAKITSLNGKSNEHIKKLKLLEDQYKKVAKEKGENSAQAKNLEIRINAEKEALSRNENQLKQSEAALERYKDGTVAAEKATEKFNAQIDSLNSKAAKLEKFGDSMNRNVTAPILAAAAASLKFASDYDESLRKVSTIVDASIVNISDLSGEVLDLSDDVNIAAENINESLYDMVSATGDSANAMDYMGVTTKASKGGYADLQVAVDGLTTVMNTYKLVGVDAMTSVSDQMITAQNYGKTTLGAISQNIGDVISSAKNMDISTQDLFGSIAALTKNGIQTGKAITGLKMAMSNVIKPTADATAEAKALGLEFNASHLKSVGWAKFIEEIGDKTGGSAESLAKLFGSVEAYNAITVLATTGTKDFKEALDAMENSQGATQAAFEKMDSGDFNEFAKSLNELKNASIEAGNSLAPMLSDLAGIVSDLAQSYKDLSPEGKKTVNVLLGIAATVGPISKMTGGAIKGFTGLSTILKKLNILKVAENSVEATEAMVDATKAGGALSGSLGSVASVALPVAAGIAAITLMIALQNKQIDEIVEKNKEASMSAEEFFEKLENNDSVKDFEEKITDATVSVERLDTVVGQTDDTIEFEVNTSVLEKAKEIVTELKVVYGDLMLALDDGTSSSDEANKAVKELGVSLIDARRDALQPQIQAVLDSNLSLEAQAELLNEINADFEDYGTSVNEAVTSIVGYNDAMASGEGITADTIANYHAGQSALAELTNEADKLTVSTKTLDDQIDLMNAGISMGAEDNGAYVLQLQELAATMTGETAPVIEEIIAAWEEYSLAIENTKLSTEELIESKGEEAAQEQELADIYKGLMGRYPNMSSAFKDYVSILLGEGDTLSEARLNQSKLFGESLTEEETLALSQLSSTGYIYSQLEGFYNEHVTAAQTAQDELSAIDSAEILDEAQVTAYEEAIARITAATEGFNAGGETSFSNAALAIKTYLEESGIELDTGLLDMLTSLGTFETDLANTTNTAGQNGLQELINPFIDGGEQAGIDAVSYFTDGIEVGIENKLDEINTSFTEMAEGNVEAFDEGLGNHSPSWKAKDSLKNFIDGGIIGIRENASRLYDEIEKVADTVSATLDDVWDINSPSKVGEEKTRYYMAGMERGFVKNMGRTIAALKNGIVEGTNDIGLTLQAQAQKQSDIYKYDNRKTIESSVTVQVSEGINGLRYRQEAERLFRDQAAIIAGG